MRRRVLAALASLLCLAACADSGGYYGGYSYYEDPFYDPWDYVFRYGIYDTQEDIDIDVDRPDLDRPDRPLPPYGLSPDPPIRPAFDRPSRPAGGVGLGGGGGSFGGGGGGRSFGGGGGRGR